MLSIGLSLPSDSRQNVCIIAKRAPTATCHCPDVKQNIGVAAQPAFNCLESYALKAFMAFKVSTDMMAVQCALVEGLQVSVFYLLETCLIRKKISLDPAE